jgi:YHS domain-containing protein
MAALVKDVVCGMMIDPATAAATSEYKSVTYYFCATGCKQEFDANPSKFVNGASAAEQPAAAAAAAPGRRWWEFWK